MSSSNITQVNPSPPASDVQGGSKQESRGVKEVVAEWAPLVAATTGILTVAITCTSAVVAWVKLGPELASLHASSEKQLVEVEKAKVEIEKARAETEKLHIELTVLRAKAKAETDNLKVDVTLLAGAEERRRQQEAVAEKLREKEAPLREARAILCEPIAGYRTRNKPPVSSREDLLRQARSLLAIKELNPDIRAAAKELEEEVSNQPEKAGEPGFIEENVTIRLLRLELSGIALSSPQLPGKQK